MRAGLVGLTDQGAQHGRGIGPEGRDIHLVLFGRNVSITFGAYLVVIKADVATLGTFHRGLLIKKYSLS